jgi:hypothetical protein
MGEAFHFNRWDHNEISFASQQFLSNVSSYRIARKLRRSKSSVENKLIHAGLLVRTPRVKMERSVHKPKLKAVEKLKIPRIFLDTSLMPPKPGPETRGVSVLDATKYQCRWPIDGIGSDGMPRCCGAEAAHKVYCHDHAVLCYPGFK